MEDPRGSTRSCSRHWEAIHFRR